NGADYIANFNILWRASEHVAAAGSLLAQDESGISKITQNGIKKILWNVVRFSNVSCLQPRPRLKLGEVSERLQTVLSFCGQHVWIIYTNGQKYQIRLCLARPACVGDVTHMLLHLGILSIDS